MIEVKKEVMMIVWIVNQMPARKIISCICFICVWYCRGGEKEKGEQLAD